MAFSVFEEEPTLDFRWEKLRLLGFRRSSIAICPWPLATLSCSRSCLRSNVLRLRPVEQLLSRLRGGYRTPLAFCLQPLFHPLSHLRSVKQTLLSINRDET